MLSIYCLLLYLFYFSTAHDLSFFAEILQLDNHEQQDPQEFSKLLFAKLDESRLSPKDNSVSNIKTLISGKETNSICCDVCRYTSNKDTDFQEISLNIDNCSTLEAALDTYLEAEKMEGENMFFCSRCDKKVIATRQTKLKALPEVVIIKFNRYFFDKKTYEKKKSQVLLSCRHVDIYIM